MWIDAAAGSLRRRVWGRLPPSGVSAGRTEPVRFEWVAPERLTNGDAETRSVGKTDERSPCNTVGRTHLDPPGDHVRNRSGSRSDMGLR